LSNIEDEGTHSPNPANSQTGDFKADQAQNQNQTSTLKQPSTDSSSTSQQTTKPPEQQDAILKEIFGERFKTVEEAKKANIAGLLDELESLRQAKSDLEKKLSEKPKHNFANDEIALFNEFVKETGIRDYGVFQKINSVDPANMDPMDALVIRYILKNPSFAGKEAQVKKYFEKKYNIDPELVSEDELEINKVGMQAEGENAKMELKSLKEKLKVPQSTVSSEPQKELTPEMKAELVSKWNDVGKRVSDVFSKIPIPIKGTDSPVVSYALSEDERREIEKFVTDYALENRMELNEANVNLVGRIVYGQIILGKLPEIVHSVFEKARQMTEKEIHNLYTNPSTQRNKDLPENTVVVPDELKAEQELFEKEMGLLG